MSASFNVARGGLRLTSSHRCSSQPPLQAGACPEWRTPSHTAVHCGSQPSLSRQHSLLGTASPRRAGRHPQAPGARKAVTSASSAAPEQTPNSEAAQAYRGIQYLALAAGVFAANYSLTMTTLGIWAVPAVEGRGTLLLRLIAAGLVPVVAALHSLADAASHDRLSSATYQKLNAGFVLFLVLTAAAAWPAALKHPAGMALAVSWLLMVNFGLNIFQQFEARTGSLAATATAAIEGTGHALASVLRVKGLLSAVYAAAAVCSAALAGAQWLAPPAAMVALGSAADGQLLGRILASTTAFAAVNLLVLKDSSERGRLGASTFKLLNLALSAASAAALVVIFLACQGAGVPVHAWPAVLRARAALSVVLASFCGGLYVVAKK